MTENATQTLPIDNLLVLETPEGVRLHVQPVGPMVRMQAWLLDLLLRGLLVAIISLGVGVLNIEGFSAGIMMIAYFVLSWFYAVFFEVFNHGQTLGKRWLKIRVIHADGTPVGWQAAILRNLMRVIDGAPLSIYGVGLAITLLSPRMQRAGDWVAGTLVVYQATQATPYRAIHATPIAPPFALKIHEQRLILDFADRLPNMTAERAHELANILIESLPTPTASANQSIPPPTQQLLHWASWLQGNTSDNTERAS